MSSFKKRVPASQPKPPPATRVNPHSAQLLVSTGVPALDDVLGGGLPVGGVLLIEQDRQTGYSNTLLSYFASQAIAAGHKLCIVNADRDVNLASQLPGWAGVSRSATEPGTGTGTETEQGDTSEKLEIAWRYQNLPRVDGRDADAQGRSEPSAGSSAATAVDTPYCEKFDLSMRIPQGVIDRASVEIVDGDAISRAMASTESSNGDMYKCVLDKISALINDGFSSLKPLPPNAERNILRIELRSLGSGFWRGSDPNAILMFLHGLRGLLRYSYAACVISFPAYLYEEAGVRLPIVRRIEHLCDAVIELESFEGSNTTPSSIVAQQIKGEAAAASQEYHGFLHIHKLPRLNSLTASMGRLSLLHTGGGSANNLAFRLRRKKFSIETYHLPIEGGVTERRVPAKEETKTSRLPSGAGCGSTPGRKDPLEF
ncbi:Elongator subunit elp4 [Coemansia aciculifera]|uniref:Elongator complex protein 4 n=1 Tax=Coemansia aciculifera TaxID=417176 RepID=A0A9W8IQ24_9FUNG|nr:Elongator subunit elp4 [Coemansia aciculifera]KAJ2884205.1 Elongator subunit elp4 [Coemansia aciculifera]